jgi:hypothetical protein
MLKFGNDADFHREYGVFLLFDINCFKEMSFMKKIEMIIRPEKLEDVKEY